MPRYWVIAPFEAEYREEWEKIWKYDLDHGLISIGWRNLGDISSFDLDQLCRLIKRKIPKYVPGTRKHVAGQLHQFFHLVGQDDVIIARRGTKMLAGIGTVDRAAYYDPNKLVEWPSGLDNAFGSHLDVRWAKLPRDISFKRPVFGITTFYEIAKEKFDALMKEAKVAPPIFVQAIKKSTNKVDDSEGQNTAGKGGGFGVDPEQNKLVEIAAINAVRTSYESHSWKVRSVEDEKCGFDLVCRKGRQVEHVEVKGVRGTKQGFIITANEIKRAKKDVNFVLVVVTSALAASPTLTRYSGPQFHQQFELTAIQYRAALRT